jgi:hypothetical protein
MKLNNLTTKSLVLSLSLLVTTIALAANPFKRPEVLVVEEPVYDSVAKNNVVNPYDQDLSLEVPSNAQFAFQDNPSLSKESVVYKGSMNGVDIYYDTATGQYIHDKEELKKVSLLISNLPDLEEVNY